MSVDYPERSDRLSVFFRIIIIIPIAIILSLLVGERETQEIVEGHAHYKEIVRVGFVVVAVLLMILFRGKYPRWWFDWNKQLTAFSLRVMSYLFLLRDEYPSTDEEQAVHIKMEYPDVENDLTRWMPLVKWFLVIPHVLVLGLLSILLVVAVFFAWVAILFTGNYPRGLFDFVLGLLRWGLRVFAYSVLMVTDKYPPFSLYE
ncbi:DUF4389 domain-containing protein [bacterium]|nr:DUF4389 domain-containing protein [bacterium]